MALDLTHWFKPVEKSRVVSSLEERTQRQTRCRRRPPSFQTSLPHYFQIKYRRPCYINKLPHEMLAEILSYLPYTFGEALFTAVHIQPFKLPDPEDERSYIISADEEEHMDRRKANGHGECLAELLFPNGCLRFCSNKSWEFLDVLCVSRRWDATIRASPGFWASIPSRTEEQVRRSIALSQSTPLYLFRIEFTKDWPSIDSFTSVVSSEISRVREIWLDGQMMRGKWAWEPSSIFQALASAREAPQLRVLRLLARRGICVLDTKDWISTNYPSLRLVDLHAVSMKTSCALFAPTLTELILTDCRLAWGSAAEPILLLARLPLLEAFQLIRTPLPSDSDYRFFNPPSELAYPLNTRLRAIGLDGSLRSIHLILGLLAFPPGEKRISLSYNHSPSDIGTANDIAQACTQLEALALTFPADFLFPAMEVKYDLEGSAIETHSRIADIGYGWKRVTANPYVEIKHYWSDSNDSLALDILSLAIRAHDPFIRRTTEMILEIEVVGWFLNSDNADFISGCYTWTADYLPRVTELRLVGEAAHSYLPWLIPKSTTPIFPRLRHLEFARVNLQETVDLPDASPAHVLFAYVWICLHLPEILETKPVVGLGSDILFCEIGLTKSMEDELVSLLGESRVEKKQPPVIVDEEVQIEVRRLLDEPKETLHVRSGDVSIVASGPRMEVGDSNEPREAGHRGLMKYFSKKGAEPNGGV